MRLAIFDAWEGIDHFGADALCITTNGFVKNNGAGVMGSGIAKEARDKIAGIDRVLGWKLRDYGNHVFWIGEYGHAVVASFPVKHHWKEKADPKLIRRSAVELMVVADFMEWNTVLVPYPGIGNGKLTVQEVHPIIEPYFDDRFVLIQKP